MREKAFLTGFRTNLLKNTSRIACYILPRKDLNKNELIAPSSPESSTTRMSIKASDIYNPHMWSS